MAIGAAAVRTQAPEPSVGLRLYLLGVSDGYLALLALLAVECLWVGAVRHDLLAGPHELGWALRGLVPVAGAAGILPALLAGAWLVGLSRSPSRGALGAGAAAAAAVGALLGWGGGAGLGASDLVRSGLAAVLCAAFGGAAYAGLPPLARSLGRAFRARGEPHPKRGLWLAGCAGCAIGCELASSLVARDVAWRSGCGLACLFALVTPLLRLTEWSGPGRGTGRLRALAAGIGFAACILAAPGAGRGLEPRDNLRRVFFDGSAWLGQAFVVADELAGDVAAPRSRGTASTATAAGATPETGFAAAAPPLCDVLLVTLGAVRPDHLGAYGSSRPTSPAFDALAAQGVLFERAYSAAPATGASLAALLTGKHVRALLRQGMGTDSETWAGTLSAYGYRTAAFAPAEVWRALLDDVPGVAADFGFERRASQGKTDDERSAELESWTSSAPAGEPLFAWLHLSAATHPTSAPNAFGQTSADRYDAAVQRADAALGKAVASFRALRPTSIVVLTADHGRELREHGGTSFGTSVYEEQVRVPLLLLLPGEPSERVSANASLVDLLPTVHATLGLPSSPRYHGRDLSPWWQSAAELRGGPNALVYAETDEQLLCAERDARLVCAHGGGACKLYDLAADPGERRDSSARNVALATHLAGACRSLWASLGRYETVAARGAARGGYPSALRRGLAGDRDAAAEVAEVLANDDVVLRRTAAEVLFELGVDATAPALRRALARDADLDVRRFTALALSRLGQGAPLALDLLTGDDLVWRRLAALALAEGGDGRGEDVLIAWWTEQFPDRKRTGWDLPKERERREPLSLARTRRIAAALGELRSRAAILPLARALLDPRLGADVAGALATIGHAAARPSLANAFAAAPTEALRLALADALVRLGGGAEVREALVTFLGAPEPLPFGLRFAMRAGILELVGGPRPQVLERLRRYAATGVAIGVVTPKGGNGQGFRLVVRAATNDGTAGEVRVGLAARGEGIVDSAVVPRRLPTLDTDRTAVIRVPPSEDNELQELYATLPDAAAQRMRAGDFADFTVHATHNVTLEALAVVPLSNDPTEGAGADGG